MITSSVVTLFMSAAIVGTISAFAIFVVLLAVCCTRKALGKCPAEGCRC